MGIEMKLRKVTIENIRSFRQPAELVVDGDLSILIGPNGGGKTNLLDAITVGLRRHILPSAATQLMPAPDAAPRHQFVGNDTVAAVTLEPHYKGKDAPQKLVFELEVTDSDMSNMVAMHDSSKTLFESAQHLFTTSLVPSAAKWDLSSVATGMKFQYAIVNNAAPPVTSGGAEVFREYLTSFEQHATVRNVFGAKKLAMPMISLPTTRASEGFNGRVSLASHNSLEARRQAEATTSRSGGQIVSHAIAEMATRLRSLVEVENAHAYDTFKNDPEMAALTATLAALGYGWHISCTHQATNQYDIELVKQGTRFRVGSASSGEKELLTYLFAIFALNVRDALIIVDEPELHLHPRWQSHLLDLFVDLSTRTGNQFLLATHSPMFVSPSSVASVSRVYSQDQESNVVRLRPEGLPKNKNLLQIVNSQNNEKMFFADKVILVEGVSDRLFFEAVFAQLSVGAKESSVCEIVSVGGKNFFSDYAALLKAASVPHMIVADLDYVDQCGGAEIKKLFAPDLKKIKKDLSDGSSKDGASLMESIEKAVDSGETAELEVIWNYVKARRRRLRIDLSDAEKLQLDEFLKERKEHGVFILSLGSLEEYLPPGHKDKDIAKTIALVADPDFMTKLPPSGLPELKDLAKRATDL
jgi:putative ATP-dependent endonuclease of OLD family